MTASSKGATTLVRPDSKKNRVWLNFKKYWMLHSMMALPMIYYILFEALPLYGLQVSFRQYSPTTGIVDSPWIGLKHYITFFRMPDWERYVVNTVVLSLYTILVGFPIPVILALMIHINKKKTLKKLTQNVSYIPHFISTVVMVGLLHQVFHPMWGLIPAIIKHFGGQYNDIRYLENTFRHLYVWSGVWQNMGWSTIVYVAALAGVSSELHEAAKIDGASRWKRVLHVDLPAIMPTVSIMMIMRFGSLMSVGHEKTLLMQHSMNSRKSDILSLHVYFKGIRSGETSYGSAIGLLNSAVNSALVILVNKITSWLTDGEQGLF